jgi:hypothetical protein
MMITMMNDEVKFCGHSVAIRDLLKLGVLVDENPRILNIHAASPPVEPQCKHTNARTTCRIGAVCVSSIRNIVIDGL